MNLNRFTPQILSHSSKDCLSSPSLMIRQSTLIISSKFPNLELFYSNALDVELFDSSALNLELSNSNALNMELFSFHHHFANTLSYVIRRFFHSSSVHLSMILGALQIPYLITGDVGLDATVKAMQLRFYL